MDSSGGKAYDGVRPDLAKDSESDLKASLTNESDELGYGVIQLNDCNTVLGRLECGMKFDIVIDSGASVTLISEDVVKASPYLRSLPLIKTEPMRIRIADGSFMVSDNQIQFEVSVQGFVFGFTAQVMPSFGLVKALLGTEDLKWISAKLDFSTNQLSFRLKLPEKVPFKVVNNTALQPGESKVIGLAGKLPKNCSSGELVLHSSKIGQKVTSSSLLTWVKKGACNILVFNDSDKMLRLNRGVVLAYADCEASHSGRYSIGEVFHSRSDSSDGYRCRLAKKNLRKYPFLDEGNPKVRMSEQEILDSEVDLELDCALSPSEKGRLKTLLNKHKKSFSLYGEVGNSQHVVKLHLVDETPFFIRPYTVSEDEKRIIDRELDKLVRMGVLEQGVASCSSPVMLVGKKGTKDKRVVSDLRFLNGRIRRQNWPFPLVRDTIQRLGMSGCSVISTLDLKEAFHSLHLDEDSQQFTGIVSYYGGKSYYYKRLPMGASISPSEFQSFVENVLDTIPGSRNFCIAHMDDLVVFSKSVSEHLEHLHLLLDGIYKHGLKLSPRKAKFCKNRVEYMGHVISIIDGSPHISAMRSKCEAIQNLKVPANSKEVRMFIGAVNYLSDYIPKLQLLLSPMHKISNKKSTFVWSKECQTNYDKIKVLLCQPPVLSMPSKEGVFVLYSDTSRIATGGTLCQVINGKEKIIGYHSKLLPGAAARYSVSELEFKGLILNIQAFRNILCSVSFYAVVDHSALVQIQKSKREPPTQRFKKFIEQLSDYSFELTYIPGNKLVLSDMISRLSAPDPCPDPDVVDPSDTVVPIACMSDPLVDAMVLTRSKAKSQGIVLGNPSEYGVQPASRKSTSVPTGSQNVPSLSSGDPTTLSLGNPTPVPSSTGITSDVPDHQLPSCSDDVQSFVPDPVQPLLPTVTPSRGEARSLVENQNRITGGQTNTEVPVNTLIPRNTLGNVDGDSVPAYSPCPDVLTRQNGPVISGLKTSQIVAGHLPRYSDVKKHLALIKQKCLRDFNIPLKAAEIKREYSNSLYFSDIYKYLKLGELPSRQRRSRSVLQNSENFVLIQDLLFRIGFSELEDVTLQLCIPESQAPFVISMYHESLMAMHQGINRTYMTIRARFFIPGLFEKLVTFIRSCSICQERKVPQERDVQQVREPRIFTEYKPFSEVHVDIKHMYPATDGSNYLVVATCVQTRYVVAIPIKNIEATTIAEVLLQRLVFQFGIPSRLVSDQASQFMSKVFSIILKTLGVDQVFVSPENHGSLVCERSIQTLSNLLISQLQGKGRSWCYFVQAACHAYNTFAHSTLGGYSPFELVYMRKPPDWLSIDSGLLKDVPVPYSDYVDQLKYRLQLIGSLVMKLHNDAQEREVQKHAGSLRKTPSYKVGQLVYFLMPRSGALSTNTRKFVVSYVGPVRVKSVLDTTHVILEDLTGRVISGIHHTNRLKPAYIRGKQGVISNMEELQENLDTYFCLGEPDCSHDGFSLLCDDGCMFTENCSDSESVTLSEGDALWCTKKRFKSGSLQVLFTNVERNPGVVPDTSNEFYSWYEVDCFPSLQEMFSSGAQGVVTGSSLKLLKQLNC